MLDVNNRQFAFIFSSNLVWVRLFMTRLIWNLWRCVVSLLKARLDLQVAIYLDAQLMAHLYHGTPSFLWWFQFSFFTNREELVGFLVSSFLFIFLGCSLSETLSCACYSPKWTEIVSKSHFICLPPLFLLLNLTLFTVFIMAHLTLLCYTCCYIYILLFPSFPPWLLM